ncbi:transcription factor S-II, central domain protein (macronuclear) [Tetrahymena thermophila SB210]|uniref:Transcription factor S-II, central domain protein n=1 Tax=Tetrahymena thermophila (strain SB210) TaxID=312017 RepID=Q22PG0_TETTS|nr:transcription factor S-II, central domain protein [Tetrahymena thermophila SB210]EAR87149.1 transcription factor S-II, central domain protein [Tetrahymena thermophila SB210]|eukprot:XP_001007394.1 transcription factor S-II, central domain protein [Tetrahymena thermophila SB210]
MNLSDYQVGDNVQINSEEHKKKVVGCIEEIDESDRTFTYGLYVYSKDIPLKQYYHGNFELFKTSSTFSDKLENIDRCVEVLKFKDYVMREQPTQERPFYVIRQYYDMQENTLTPEELKPCICDKVVNPDENIVMCFNCNDLFYHDFCLQMGAKCQGCSSLLKDETLLGKRSSVSSLNQPDIPTLQQSKSNVSQKIDVEDDLNEEMEPTKLKLDTSQVKEFFLKAKREAEAKKKQEELKKQQLKQQKLQNENKINQAKKENNLQKKESSSALEFSNLGATQNEKIQSLVNRYKKFNPIGNSTGPEKKRMEVREKFFEYLIYGLIEFEENESILNEEEKKILLQDSYEIARKLAVEIESNLFNINNSHNKYALKEQYKNRCKILFVHLKDPQNFNFRRKILNKQMKPIQLCTINEQEMFNPFKLQEIENQKIKLLNRDTIDLSDKIIIFKTNKGEQIVNYSDNKDQIELEEQKLQGESNLILNNTSVVKSINGNNNNLHLSNNLNIPDSMEIQSNDQLVSESSCELKTIRNPFFDQTLVDSLSNLVGQSALKKIQDRLYADLPEKEAKYLADRLVS